MDGILENCPGTISIADDIGVFGSSEREHYMNLHNFMRVVQTHGVGGKWDIKSTLSDQMDLYFSNNNY